MLFYLRQSFILLLLIVLVSTLSSCGSREPSGVYSGQAEGMDYVLDFRQDGTVLIKEKNLIASGMMRLKFGVDVPARDVLAKWNYDGKVVSVRADTKDNINGLNFRFEGVDLIENQSHERFASNR
jgi:uncharacterized lipoprotein YehR (DUF1307 family)